MSGSRPNPEQNEPVWTREVELRREIVAAMRLRRENISLASAKSGPGRLLGWRCAGTEGMGSRPMADSPRGSRATENEKAAARVLTVSDYEGLRSSRALLLEGAGYRVASMSSRGLLDATWATKFDIAILCQSVDENNAARVAEMLRHYHPGIRILRIHSMRFAMDSVFDLELEGFAGPESLLEAVRGLVSRGARTQTV